MSTPQTRRKMLANRKVVTVTCTSCGQPFCLGEEVYLCSECSGYHHSICWDRSPRCDVLPSAPVTLRSETASVGDTPSGGAAAAIAVAERAIVSPDLASDGRVLGEDERCCPGCGEAIKRDAMKCRFCGRLLDEKLVRQVEEEMIPEHVLEAVRQKANESIWMCALGGLICGIFFIPAGISRARQALRMLDAYPNYQTPLRRRARIGLTIGCVFVALWILGALARLSEASAQ